jgi:serine/threonine protein kinase
MSMTQTTMEISPTGSPQCPKCKAVLPRQASFCASCGERITKKTVVSLVYTDTDITSRYRITSLVRRRPYISLYFAIDSQYQRPVVIREITVRSLQDEARLTASQVVQDEYDLLRHEHIPSVLPVIDLLHSQGQLYVVAGWPTKPDKKTTTLQLQTLQDILQSGIGLPKMQTALSWIEQLCGTVDNLHRHQIILGDLDPQALILNGDTYESELALMASWLPSAIRDLLPPTSSISSTTNFSAPEVLLDTPEPRSDVYSLGAVLYLLLTGVAPDEPTARMQRRLRSPNELNFRISHALDEFVMQALALEPGDRFQSIREMGEALYCVRAGIKRTCTRRAVQAPLPTIVEATASPTPTDESARREAHSPTIDEVEATASPTPTDESTRTEAHSPTIDEIVDIKTVLITPLPSPSLKARLETNIPTIDPQSEAQDASPQALDAVEDKLLPPPPRTIERNARDLDTPVPAPPIQTEAEHTKNSFANSFKKRITGILPAIPRSQKLPVQRPKKPTPVVLVPSAAPSIETEVEGKSEKDRSLLKQLQRLILGEQKQVTTAAAIIETPLRIQPNQSYAIRIQLMGRDQPRYPHPVEAHKGARVGGLSSLVEGETVYIEVRSALYQSYAYIVQQAAVSLPGQGYAAEVTIPMQPLSNGPNGRRDRLHIFFMDDARHPLYEKPFVVELFISHLVQPGREGHNVLTIPL